MTATAPSIKVVFNPPLISLLDISVTPNLGSNMVSLIAESKSVLDIEYNRKNNPTITAIPTITFNDSFGVDNVWMSPNIIAAAAATTINIEANINPGLKKLNCWSGLLFMMAFRSLDISYPALPKPAITEPKNTAIPTTPNNIANNCPLLANNSYIAFTFF